MYQTAVPQQPVQCHCRAVYTRAQRLSPALRFQNSRLADHVQRSTAGRLRPLRASKDSKQSHNKPNPQQPEVHPESIPTDEATEADEAVPATAPVADASAPQAGSKAQPNAKAQKGSQASQAKGKPDYEMAGPLADWLKDAAAEMKKQGVNQKFTDSFLGDLVNEISMQTAATEATYAAAQATAAQLLQISKDQYIRLNADFDNFRRRTAGEKLALKDTTKGDVIVKLVPLIDNFEAAKNSIKVQTDAEQKIVDSYQGLYKQMVDTFRSLGVEAVPGVGHPFDPNFHEAIVSEPNDDVPDGTVLQEFRKGFQCGDRLIRPAMVKVSSSDIQPPAKQSSKEGVTNGSQNGDIDVEVEDTVDAGAKFD
ncbi:hypothetical protein WJX79_008362 [Trebouxia sp. C0005]|nr:MAG: nucleotide release factor [Trebouxia sp. A1-2]